MYITLGEKYQSRLINKDVRTSWSPLCYEQVFQPTPLQSTATSRRTGTKYQRSCSSESSSFLKLHQIHLTFWLKETAPISFCLLKLRFLLFRFLLELVFSLFYNPVLLPDSLCLVIHLPVFVFTPLPVRLLTLLFSSLKLAFRLHFQTKPFLLLVLCCFIYIELAGSMERHALRMRQLLVVKT